MFFYTFPNRLSLPPTWLASGSFLQALHRSATGDINLQRGTYILPHTKKHTRGYTMRTHAYTHNMEHTHEAAPPRYTHTDMYYTGTHTLSLPLPPPLSLSPPALRSTPRSRLRPASTDRARAMTSGALSGTPPSATPATATVGARTATATTSQTSPLASGSCA